MPWSKKSSLKGPTVEKEKNEVAQTTNLRSDHSWECPSCKSINSVKYATCDTCFIDVKFEKRELADCSMCQYEGDGFVCRECIHDPMLTERRRNCFKPLE